MLSPGDVAIARLYKTLLGLAQQVAGGEDPVGLAIDPPRIKGVNGRLQPGERWQLPVPEHVPRRPAAVPTPVPTAVLAAVPAAVPAAAA